MLRMCSTTELHSRPDTEFENVVHMPGSNAISEVGSVVRSKPSSHPGGDLVQCFMCLLAHMQTQAILFHFINLTDDFSSVHMGLPHYLHLLIVSEEYLGLQIHIVLWWGDSLLYGGRFYSAWHIRKVQDMSHSPPECKCPMPE